MTGERTKLGTKESCVELTQNCVRVFQASRPCSSITFLLNIALSDFTTEKCTVWNLLSSDGVRQFKRPINRASEANSL